MNRRRFALVGVTPPLLGVLRETLSGNSEVVEIEDRLCDGSSMAEVGRCSHVVLGSPVGDITSAVDAAGLGTWRALESLQPQVVVQLSSMKLFEPYDPAWAVIETWSTWPQDSSLACHLAELMTREVGRVRSMRTVVLRMAPVVSGDVVLPDEVHVDDAASSIMRAIAAADQGLGDNPWQVFHVVSGKGRFPLSAAARAPLAWKPEHMPIGEDRRSGSLPPRLPDPVASIADLERPRRVTVFGAGGPLGAAAAAALLIGRADRNPERPQMTLRLTDARPFDVIRAHPPQSPGAPLPADVMPPHQVQLVDITDEAAVMEAAAGAEALINCSVARIGAENAFRVNVLGALNVMRAAVGHGIRKVVHTGPAMGLLPDPWGYLQDKRVDANAPDRAGDNLYFLTKLLGREIVRVFAEQYRIASPALLFDGLVDPTRHIEIDMTSFLISWEDAGRCVAAAVDVSTLPEPSPNVLVMAPSPHGRYVRSSADMLGWQPVDRLESVWTRPKPDQ